LSCNICGTKSIIKTCYNQKTSRYSFTCQGTSTRRQ